MVIVMPTQKYQLDFVTLTSIDYCLKRCGGPALVFNKNMDFSPDFPNKLHKRMLVT